MANEKRKEYVFTWEIENISMCLLETGECIESPIFKAENLSDSDWYLTLYPKGEVDSTSDYISVYLNRKQDNEETVYYKIELIDNVGNVFLSYEVEKTVFDDIYSCIGYPDCLSREKLNEKMRSWSEDILTIRCHILSDSASEPALGSVTRTKLFVDQCCYCWNVKVQDSSISEIDQNIFFSEKIQLKLTLTTSGDKIEIDIQRNEKEIFKIELIRVKISLLNLKGKEVISQSSQHLFKIGNASDRWKFPSFLSKKDLQDKMDDIMVDDFITLKCEISVSNGENYSEVKSIKYNDYVPSNKYLNDSISDLLEDVRKMLITSKNSDVKFRVENQIIPAHKFMICARSPVFSAMFDQNMSENQTGIVDVEDLEAKTVKSILEFIYTGNISELDLDISMKLLVAADKYQIPSLRDKCSAFLITELSVENVCSIYTVADLIRNENLKSSALIYIEKKSKEVLKSNIWLEWMDENVNLANEILFKLALG